MNDSPPDQTEAANPEEEAYIRGLSEFGEVVKPPPCFSMAARCATGTGMTIEALDMDDEHYTAAYCRYVGTLDMIRQGNSGKRLARYVFISETPEEFVMEWDGVVNRLSGYRELEDARERWLAKGIAGLAAKYGRVVVVVELERLAGIGRHLGAAGCEPELVH